MLAQPRVRILVGAVMVIIIGGIALVWWIMHQSQSTSMDDNTTTQQEVREQQTASLKNFEDIAGKYQKGTMQWANIYSSAAVYAANNGMCSRAQEIVHEITSANIKDSDRDGLVDTLTTQVKEACP